MGRAIDMENDIDKLRNRLKTVEDALEDVALAIEDIMDIVDKKEKKNVKKKTDNKGNAKSNKQPDNGDAKSSKKDD